MKWLGIFLIRAYQVTLGPLFGGSCRFEPSCSNYGLQAVERFGLLKGSWLTLRRLLRCRPFGPHGYDPIPDEWPGLFGPLRIAVLLASSFAVASADVSDPPFAMAAAFAARTFAAAGAAPDDTDASLARRLLPFDAGSDRLISLP